MLNAATASPPMNAEPFSLARLIGKVAAIIGSENFPTGERAALKRLTPDRSPSLVFYRFCFQHLPDGWQRQMSAWQAALAGLALMGTSAHNPKRPLGQALAEQRYSEARLERLLAAQDDVLYTLTLRVARFLAAKGESVNWLDLSQLLLAQDREKCEAVRLRIAGDYYRYYNNEKD
ncbi:MAG: type I-E CRISPR-associated protein Cse2/CasB [Candidatus Competibacteraceae bacterium]|nr:type I-E CRISPR-associated protein Cse2/CasB [Candidatus Competibacteraceae bacterium]MCP5125397.1 type I-E CRISPR-associated protein Cse2/CasB [Gammaproteobacteria bacterium]HRX71533.1 type I-E CRISPR-associated protein Cse2/CasB [Candidatus Competibacteraceae bacterium]